MTELEEIVRQQNVIVRKVAPEIDHSAQEILYRTALNILGGDVEKFKEVLANAEKLQSYKGNHSDIPDRAITKGSYAIVLALNGNNIEEARRYNEIAGECLANIPWLRAFSRIAVAYADKATKGNQ